MKRKGILAIVGVVVFFCAIATSGYGIGWALVNSKIRRDFPEVKRITTTELAAWLSDKQQPPPLLLDVRTDAEYGVSHLQNAEHVEPDAAAAALHEAKNRPIVTYCSVGYRSGAFAQRLRAAGFTNVQNLEGSIFQWVNEGRPVFRRGEAVDKVHPYNWMWGLLLRKEHRAQVATR